MAGRVCDQKGGVTLPFDCGDGTLFYIPVDMGDLCSDPDPGCLLRSGGYDSRDHLCGLCAAGGICKPVDAFLGGAKGGRTVVLLAESADVSSCDGSFARAQLFVSDRLYHEHTAAGIYHQYGILVSAQILGADHSDGCGAYRGVSVYIRNVLLCFGKKNCREACKSSHYLVYRAYFQDLLRLFLWQIVSCALYLLIVALLILVIIAGATLFREMEFIHAVMISTIDWMMSIVAVLFSCIIVPSSTIFLAHLFYRNKALIGESVHTVFVKTKESPLSAKQMHKIGRAHV